MFFFQGNWYEMSFSRKNKQITRNVKFKCKFVDFVLLFFTI